ARAALARHRPDGEGGMTRTVWLASYPKSGNTWLRMLIANLSANEAPMNINDLPQRGGIASARAPFDYLTLIDSGLLTHDEVDVRLPRRGASSRCTTPIRWRPPASRCSPAAAAPTPPSSSCATRATSWPRSPT